eukprot:RCo026349
MCECMVYRAVDFKPPSSLFPVGSVITWNQPSSASKSAKVVREFLRQDSALGPPWGTIYTIGSRTGRFIAEFSVFPSEEEVLLPCGSQFRVVGKASFGFKKLLEEAMECDLSNVDIIALEEVVVLEYREVPLAMTAEEQRRNPKVKEFCSTYPTMYMPLRTNHKEKGTTVVHIAAAVPENESVVQLVCCRMKDECLGVHSDEGKTALQVSLSCTEGGEGASLYLARRATDLDYLQLAEREVLLSFAVARGSLAVLKRTTNWLSELVVIRVKLIHLGVCTGQSEVLKFLLEAFKPLDLNAPEFSLAGQPLLHLAARDGHDRCVSVLCEYEVNVDSLDEEGRTALYLSSRFGHAEVVEQLCEHLASINITTSFGDTPLC